MSEASVELAARVVEQLRSLGASEASVSVSEGTSTEISRRDGKVEQASESVTRGLSLAILVDERWSSHSTSDLRPDALEPFLRRAVEATRYLEPDPDRALPPRELCGRGASEADLDHLDPAWARFTPADRAARVAALEDAVLARRDDRFVSATAHISDGSGHYAQVTSHGFSDVTAGAWFSLGTSVTLADEGGRRPEGDAFYAARYLADLPTVESIADDAFDRAREAIGSGPTDSGRYPMILLNRVAGRVLGTLGAPLAGSALHHGRSCLADKLGTKVGSDLLTILDDPTIPRGLGSTPWDGDLMVARPRTIVENGVLKSFYLPMYYARKLAMAPTTGGKTNWVVPAGTVPWRELARRYDRAILVTGFLGGNANPLTGDFSYGIRGRLLERGEPTRSLSEMNVSGNVLTIFHQLVAAGDDPWTWGSTIAPTLVFEDVAFSGT
jgi:PmbA protein